MSEIKNTPQDDAAIVKRVKEWLSKTPGVPLVAPYHDAISELLRICDARQDQIETLVIHVMEVEPDERRWAVELVDPDWTDHWHELSEAFHTYWNDDAARVDMVAAMLEGYK